jgi:hypothetical protein
MFTMLYTMNCKCKGRRKAYKRAIIMQQVLQLSPHVFPYKPYNRAMLLQQPLLHLHYLLFFVGHEYDLLLAGKTGAKIVYNRTPNVGIFRPPVMRAKTQRSSVALYRYTASRLFRFVLFHRFGIVEMSEHSMEKV